MSSEVGFKFVPAGGGRAPDTRINIPSETSPLRPQATARVAGRQVAALSSTDETNKKICGIFSKTTVSLLCVGMGLWSLSCNCSDDDSGSSDANTCPSACPANSQAVALVFMGFGGLGIAYTCYSSNKKSQQ